MGHSAMERIGLIRLLLFLLFASLQPVFASATNHHRIDLLVIVGAGGQPEFESVFKNAAEEWIQNGLKSSKHGMIIEPDARTNELARIDAALAAQPESPEELWIVLIGHGTFDGKEAKFNLAGPDLSGAEAAKLLSKVNRPIIFIDTSSSSSPFINEISGPNRIVITASRSGWEQNYARFGVFLAKSIVNPAADIDKDGQVSLLEAFLTASRDVEDFYKGEKRLATEHALIDDNGDKKGTSAAFFRGVRAVKRPDDSSELDGFRAHQLYFLPNAEEARLSPEQRKRRNDLELTLEKLRVNKGKIAEDEYLNQIEPILLELAKLYQKVDSAAGKH
jgi:hypothetical protein